MSKIIKNTVFVLFCMLLHTLGTKLNSQPQPEFICGTCQMQNARQGMHSSQNNSLSKVTTPLGGDRKRIETKGTLKILIIFAKFNGDNDDVGYWPANTPNNEPPFPNIIDSIVRPTYTNYPPYSISSFFKEMSNGSFNVIGKVYPMIITTNQPQSYYRNLYTDTESRRNGLVNLFV